MSRSSLINIPRLLQISPFRWFCGAKVIKQILTFLFNVWRKGEPCSQCRPRERCLFGLCIHPDDARLFEAIMKPTRKHPQESRLMTTQTTQSTMIMSETTDMIEMDFDYENSTNSNQEPTLPTNADPAGDELIIPDVIRLIEFNYENTDSSTDEGASERIIQKSIDDQSREKMEQMPETDWDTSQYDDNQHYDVLYEYGDENIAKMTGQVTEVTEATLELPNDSQNEPSDQYSYSSYSSYDDEADYYNPDDINPIEDYVQLTTKVITTTTSTPPLLSGSTTPTATTTTTPVAAQINDIENLSFLRHHSPLSKDIDQNGTCTQINIDSFFPCAMKHPH